MKRNCIALGTSFVAILLFAGGCGHAERTARAKEDATKTQQVIMEQLHIPAVVHTHVYTGTDGHRCDVTVQLLGKLPEVSAVDIRRQVARIVGKTFRDEVTSLRILL